MGKEHFMKAYERTLPAKFKVGLFGIGLSTIVFPKIRTAAAVAAI